MDWTNWQTYAALAAVLLTLGIFVRRWIKAWFSGNKKNCCGGSCGCDTARKHNVSKAD